MWRQSFSAAWPSLLPRQQDPCPLRNTPSQLSPSSFIFQEKKQPQTDPLSQSQFPAPTANSNWSCANAVLPFLRGMGLPVRSIPSFHLMPGLAQRSFLLQAPDHGILPLELLMLHPSCSCQSLVGQS